MEEQVIKQIEALCANKFGGSLHAMFIAYAPDGKLTYAELYKVLTDAGIGNVFTRGIYCNRIIAALDLDKDGCISENELAAAITAHGG
jgi:hypothetical protein